MEEASEHPELEGTHFYSQFLISHHGEEWVQLPAQGGLSSSELGGELRKEAAIAETQRMNFLPGAYRALLLAKDPVLGLKVNKCFALFCFACMRAELK